MNTLVPRVSVFIPTYNHVRFVEVAIESVLQQEYPNIEIVVGDDGSTDGTQEILRRYRDEHPALFKLILSPTNLGITANCNKIIQACSGEYVAMFAGDDLWLPGKLARQVSLMESDPTSSVCIGKVVWFESETGKYIRTYPSGDFDVTGMGPVETAYYVGSTGMSMLARRDCIPEYGFDPRIPMVSDWLFYIELLRRGKPLFINEPLAMYRRHKGNTSLRSEMLIREHLLTLQILESRYPEMRESAASFLRKYILIASVDILRETEDSHTRRQHLLSTMLKVSPSDFIWSTLMRILNPFLSIVRNGRRRFLRN